MISCSILTNIHPMLGVDVHQGTPGPPAPPVPMPHFVAQVLGGLPVVGSAKLVPTVLSHNFITLNQGTDIGMGIGHVAPNILFPLYVLTSSSTSHFGSFSVLSSNLPTSAAVGVYVNFNLNCGWPLNMPTGLVVAPGCNMVGLSPADLCASAVSMSISMVISFITTKIGDGIGNRLGGAALRGVASIAGRFSVSAGLFRGLSFGTLRFLRGVSSELVGAVAGVPTGIPFGFIENTSTESIQSEILPAYSQGELLN